MWTLRPQSEDDTPGLLDLLSDPEVAFWLRPSGVSGPFTRAECEQMVRRGVAHWQAHGFGPWLAWDGDACIGRGLLKHTILDGRGEVEAGWTVARSRWGTGIATAMGRHALATAVEHGVTSVVAFTRTDNGASQRVMEKLGMTFEREITHAGLPHVLHRITLPRSQPGQSPPR